MYSYKIDYITDKENNMLGLSMAYLDSFRKQTGTKVKMVVEYELDYSEIIDKDNVDDIVDMQDIVGDPQNIVGIRDLKFKSIRS